MFPSHSLRFEPFVVAIIRPLKSTYPVLFSPSFQLCCWPANPHPFASALLRVSANPIFLILTPYHTAHEQSPWASDCVKTLRPSAKPQTTPSKAPNAAAITIRTPQTPPRQPPPLGLYRQKITTTTGTKRRHSRSECARGRAAATKAKSDGMGCSCVKGVRGGCALSVRRGQGAERGVRSLRRRGEGGAVERQGGGDEGEPGDTCVVVGLRDVGDRPWLMRPRRTGLRAVLPMM